MGYLKDLEVAALTPAKRLAINKRIQNINKTIQNAEKHLSELRKKQRDLRKQLSTG